MQSSLWGWCYTDVPRCPLSPLFVTLIAMEGLLPEEGDIHSSVSAFLAGRRNLLLVMTIRAGWAGLTLSPPLIPKPMFLTPALPDVWQCAGASWHEPLKTIVPFADSMDFFRVEGHTETSSPSVPLVPSCYHQCLDFQLTNDRIPPKVL